MIFYRNTRHVMLDIEALGLEPGCIVLSAALKAFDVDTDGIVHEASSTFEWVLDTTEQLLAGMKINPDTLAWWQHADRATARTHLTTRSAVHSLRTMHTQMEAYISDNTQVWANSPSYDCRILNAAFKAAGLRPLWQFWQERDMRTLVGGAPDDCRVRPSMDVAHTAAGDVDAQVATVAGIIQLLNGK